MLIIGRAESLPIWCTIPTVNWEIFTVKNNSQFAGTTKIKHVKYFFQRIIKTLKIYGCLLVAFVSPQVFKAEGWSSRSLGIFV